MKLDVYFGDLHITDLVSLAQNIYLYPDESYTLLLSQEFQNALKEEEPFLYPQFLSCLNIPEDDVFLFKVSYLFCPYMTFRYQGYKFDDLKELGEKILLFGPNIDVYLEDILKYKLLSFYFKIQKKDVENNLLFSKIIELENLYIENPAFAYFTLGFKLSEIPVIIYKGRPFVTPQSFFEYVTNDVNITEFATNFEKDQYVFAWLTYLGYKDKLNEYHALVKLISEKESLKHDSGR